MRRYIGMVWQNNAISFSSAFAVYKIQDMFLWFRVLLGPVLIFTYICNLCTSATMQKCLHWVFRAHNSVSRQIMCCYLNKTTRVITAVVAYANGGMSQSSANTESEKSKRWCNIEKESAFSFRLWHFVHVCTLCIVQVHNYRISHKLYTQFYRIFAAIKVLNRTYDSNLLLFRLLVRLISFFNHFHLHLHFDFLFSSSRCRSVYFTMFWQLSAFAKRCAQAHYRNHILLSYNENSLNAMTWKHTL